MNRLAAIKPTQNSNSEDGSGVGVVTSEIVVAIAKLVARIIGLRENQVLTLRSAVDLKWQPTHETVDIGKVPSPQSNRWRAAAAAFQGRLVELDLYRL